MTKNKYVVVAEHDLIVLDYLSDQLNVLYGQSSVYGRVSKAYSSRVGINNFLRGYLPAENVQIRKEEIKFEFRDMSELDLLKNVKEKVVWSHIRKNLGGFRLEVEEGAAREGEIIGVLGPNGIGKTTFARILVGEIQPDEGFVNTVGLTLSYKPQKILPEYDGTVQQYLEEVRKDALSSTSWFYTEVVRRLNLHRILESKLTDLSGGELQKLYITGALAKDADVYVLDEPSSYLDVEERYVVAKAIKKIIRERKSICFVVEHDLAIHNYIADRIMVFKGVPGLEGHGTTPLSLRLGMNEFLKLMDLTFRRDGETGRPRVNKPGSYLDRVQKELGEYFSTRVVKEAEAE
jgi:Predicted ATPase, RNase L inhibitor (RLI) homolog